MSKSLLVVDDSTTIREAVRHALAGEDWTVVIASSPSEALEIFRDRSFDAVLCDVSLRDADGYEMCRTLRTADGAGEPSIILMGAKVNDTAAMAAGASGTLLKPFESQEILEALEGMPDRDEAFVDIK